MTRTESKSVSFLFALIGLIAVAIFAVILRDAIFFNKSNSESGFLNTEIRELKNHSFKLDSIAFERLDTFYAGENNLTFS